MNTSFNGFMLVGGIIALSLLMTGAYMAFFMTAAHRLAMARHQAGQKGWSGEMFFLDMAAAVIGVITLILAVWGTFFCKMPYTLQAYHDLGSWLFAVSIRFSGFWVLCGTGIYPTMLDVSTKLTAWREKWRSWRRKGGATR